MLLLIFVISHDYFLSEMMWFNIYLITAVKYPCVFNLKGIYHEVSVFLICLPFSIYASPIMQDSAQVALELKMGNVVNVIDCNEFNQLIDSGERIIGYPGTPDRFISDVNDSLVQCKINNYKDKNHLKEVSGKGNRLTIHDILVHFPASEAIAISNSDVDDLNKNYKGKSIFQKEDDLVITDNENKAVSNKNGYFIYNLRVLQDKNDNVIRFITLSNFVTEGSWSTSDTYKIVSTKKNIWDIKKISVNDPN